MAGAVPRSRASIRVEPIGRRAALATLDESDLHPRPIGRWVDVSLTGIALILLLGIVVRQAWITDDAYITFRVVDNWLEGRGLTWNPGTRVQVFTHPLWMLLVAAARALSGELFYTALGLSIALTLAAAVLLIWRLARSLAAATLGLALLAGSRAFTEFSTSGLENPLLHLLLLLLLVAAAARPATFLRRTGFSLVAGLCLLTRPDVLCLILPAWAVFFWRTRARGSLAALAVGLTPLVAWCAFALVYYGSPIPNTALAKLGTGIPRVELLAQGVQYLVNSLLWDPLTLVTIVAALAAALWLPGGAGRPESRSAWAWGIVAMLAYDVWVGGDFMSGRFLTSSFVVATGLIVSRPPRRPAALAMAFAALLLLVIPWTSPFHHRDYGKSWHAAIDARGIADERTFYLDSGTLSRSWGKAVWPGPVEHAEAEWLHRNWPRDYLVPRLYDWGVLDPVERWPPPGSRDVDGRPFRRVFVRGAVGFLGYHLGAESSLLDYHAITDPLLSRLPAERPDPVLAAMIPPLAERGWRVGHYLRSPPPGYLRTLATGRNEIRDPALARYYDVVRALACDPVLDRDRLGKLWRFWRGDYDELLAQAITARGQALHSRLPRGAHPGAGPAPGAGRPARRD